MGLWTLALLLLSLSRRLGLHRRRGDVGLLVLEVLELLLCHPHVLGVAAGHHVLVLRLRLLLLLHGHPLGYQCLCELQVSTRHPANMLKIRPQWFA